MAFAYVQGAYVPLQQASVPMFDRAYHFADAVYEVIAFFNRRFLDEDRHLKRLARSLKELDIAPPMPEGALKLVMRELLARNNLSKGGIYLQVGRGTAARDHAYTADLESAVSMFLFPPKTPAKALMEKGVNVLVAEDQRWGRCDIKTVGLLPNVIAKQAASKVGARETWLHRGGMVTEGAVSNSFIVKHGTIITQPLGPLILGGVTRDVLLDLARTEGIAVEERGYTLDEARSADEAFLTSSTSNVLPVTSIEGKPVGNGGVGLVTTRLIELYADHVEQQTGYRLPIL